MENVKSKRKNGGRSKIFINKDVLTHLITVGFNNTGMFKTLKVRHTIVACWVKENDLGNILQEPEDDNVIIKDLEEVIYFHKDLRVEQMIKLNYQAY